MTRWSGRLVPRRSGLSALTILLLCVAPSSAPCAQSEAVLARVRDDLAAGRDVVIASYVGLWYDHNDDPVRNLYWGNAYGHDTMFESPRRIRDRLPFVEMTGYSTLLTRQRTEDPIAIKVIGARAALPGTSGNPGRILVVNLAYKDMELATYRMGVHLKTGAPPPELAQDEEVTQYLRQSYVIGYWGHNVYYGGNDVDDLERMQVTATDGPRGVFMIGCMTARWFPQKVLTGPIEPIVFTRTNMAPEAYIAVALYDGLGRGLALDRIRANIATAYGIYQRLPRAPVSLFIVDRETIQGLADTTLESDP